MMSQTTIILTLALVAIIVVLLLAYIVWGTRQNRKNKNGYNWQPEQDFDVVQEGESSMTPPFPVLVKRDKKPANSD